MSRLNIENIKKDRISIQLEDSNESIKIIFNGDIDMEDPSILLDPFFDKIHQGVIKENMKMVNADFKNLNFLNSSGIKAIAKWIMKLNELSDDERYIIKIIHNKDITWQVTSLPTLTFLVPGGVKIE